MATSNLTENVVGIDEKVKGSAGDPTPDYLDGKVDATTITVVGDELVRAALTGDVTTVGNAATVVGGNADTVTTNANLTGVVTSVGNATAIADKALAVAKLADGTDGELLTWDGSGVIDTVAAGASTEVLTSNGAGFAPTFQAAGGGGGFTFIQTNTFSAASDVTITQTISADEVFLIVVEGTSSTGGGNDYQAALRINNNSSNSYLYLHQGWESLGVPTQYMVSGGSSRGAEIFITDGNSYSSALMQGDPFTLKLWITARNSDTKVEYHLTSGGQDGEADCFEHHGQGWYDDTTPTSVNIIRLGGTETITGRYYVYQLAKS